jgi:hypothetical protein
MARLSCFAHEFTCHFSSPLHYQLITTSAFQNPFHHLSLTANQKTVRLFHVKHFLIRVKAREKWQQ